MRILTVASVLLGASALHAAAEDPPKCTPAQVTTVANRVDSDCSSILYHFQACSDHCRSQWSDLVQIAPNCSAIISPSTLRQLAGERLAECEAALANDTHRYTPRLSPTAEECDLTEIKAWNKNYGIRSFFRECKRNVTASCSDDCLKALEEGVQAAPMCRDTASSHLTYFEQEKSALASCVTVRGESVLTNAVLQSTTSKNTNGSVSESAGTVRPRWTVPPRTRADLATPAPSATAASGASHVAIPVATSIVSAAIALVAVLL